MIDLAKMMVLACGSLALVHCATPNLPNDDLSGESGRDESARDNAPSTPLPAKQDETGSTAPAQPGTPAGATTCDTSLPFGAPLLVAGLPSDTDLATPRLSHDELALYLTTHVNGQARVARAVRPSLAAPFGAPALIDVQSTAAKDNDPSVSADGSTLWFSSERTGKSDKLFMATLDPTSGMFGAPTLVSSVASSAAEEHPYYRVGGGGELWFSSSRSGQWNIYVAKKNPTGFDAPQLVEELRSSAASRQPMITEDGLTILFASERAGGSGQRDLWTARRPSTNRPFDAPQVVANVNSAADEYAGWLSGDGCRVYFSSDRGMAEHHRIYVASRPATQPKP